MCDSCFQELAPELAEAVLALQPKSSIQLLEPRACDTCANCGGDLSGSRFAAHHFGDPHCTFCFEEEAPGLAALLIVGEAALEAAAGARDAAGLLRVAVSFSRLLYRLDKQRPRTVPGPELRPEPRRRSRPRATSRSTGRRGSR